MLPKMDIPVALVEWELFVPDRYRVRRFDGNAMLEPAPMSLVEGHGSGARGGVGYGAGNGIGAGAGGGTGGGPYVPGPGRLVGQVVDSSGAVMPGATVTAHYRGQLLAQTVTNGAGWFLLTGVRSGRITLTASMPGTRRQRPWCPWRRPGLRASTFAWSLAS